uniref:Uncharacterized protein n=1 Tax=Candidatus Methanogaster sp. ANME-2c ERB4 TaxID=2759911 RepID=A0A7G9Y7Q4_9EURY|nr:hypothetical protein FAIOLEIP_00006 [Methanosarcinales archaeon ANME-2c ERB4]QNO44038.1 hypothetical protein JGGIPCKB_00011 [Methanosarcinales archaeon ANME-2c ERB4]QNO50455.1 hypothetical protein BPCBKEJI_00033 [Methanosarcinales archaeon ANME-2c ERB4]
MVFALFSQMWKVLFGNVKRNLPFISSVIKITERPERWRRWLNPNHESRVFCCNWCLLHRCGSHRCQQATVPEKPAGSSLEAMKRPGLDGRAHSDVLCNRAKTAQNFPALSAMPVYPEWHSLHNWIGHPVCGSIGFFVFMRRPRFFIRHRIIDVRSKARCPGSRLRQRQRSDGIAGHQWTLNQQVRSLTPEAGNAYRDVRRR